MNRVMKKIWKLPLIVWLFIAFGVGIGVGAVMYTLVISGTLTILPPAEGIYEIKVYSDVDCTQELAFIDWGEVHAGDYVSFSFYVKNTGTVTIPIIEMSLEVPSVVNIDFATRVENLEPGQVRYVELTNPIPAEAGAGTYSVELKLECCA